MEKPQQSIDPLDSDNMGIYGDAENGPCEICMVQEEDWNDRVIDETFFIIFIETKNKTKV